MSFGAKTAALPATPQKPLGVDESRAATNEEARPLPYLAGRTRVGVTWLTDALDIKADAVVSSVGKGQSSVRGYNYRATLAALICHGPVDQLEKIYFNGDEVWSGTITRDSEDYADITIETHGQTRIYWGTNTQEPSPELIALGYIHPPYRRQCYMTFKDLFFGFNQTNAPNIEVVVARYPKPLWMDAGIDIDINGDCNPVAIISEWLQSKVFGLGLPNSRLDTDALNTTATQLASEGIGLSPYLTKQTSARQLITQLCEYFDGYPLLTPEGKFKLGLVRAAADENALPLINEDVLLSEPEMNPESWSEVKTKTWVKFTDANKEWKENALPYRAAGAAQIYGDNSPQTLDRMWVTNAQLAQKIVAATGRAQALPSSGGNLSVRKSVTLKPGDLFRLSYERLGISNMVMRVESRSTGDAGERGVDLSVRLDRSYLNDTYYLPSDDVTPQPVDTTPEPFDENAQRLIELPLGLAVDGKITIAPLVARPNFFTTGYNIWLRRNYDLGSANIPSNPSNIDNGLLVEDYGLTDIVDETVGCVVQFSSGQYNTWKSYCDAAKLIIDLQTETTICIGFQYISDISARAYLIRARDKWGMRTHTGGKGIRYWISPIAMYTLNYDQLGSDNQFSKHGTVAEDYSAQTDLIDQRIGLLVTMDAGESLQISPSLNNALANELLVFVGDEILSVVSATQVSSSPTQCRLYCIRGRYDTRAITHATGESVFIIQRANLKLLTSTTFQKGTRPTFKLQPTVLDKSVDLSAIKPVGVKLTNRINRPGTPLNLAAFNDGYSPVYSSGDNIPLTWNLVETGTRDFWGRWGNPASIAAQTELNFYTASDELKFTHLTAPGETSYLFETVATYFTAENIKITAQTLQNGIYSQSLETLTVTFV